MGSEEEDIFEMDEDAGDKKKKQHSLPQQRSGKPLQQQRFTEEPDTIIVSSRKTGSTEEGVIEPISNEWVSESIKEFTIKNPELSVAAGAVQILCEAIRRSRATTVMGLRAELTEVVEQLKLYSSSLSLTSSCDLFLIFVTRTYLDIPNFVECKERLRERGERFVKNTEMSRQRIAELGHPFIRDGATVLTHGYSRVVCAVLAAAAAQNKRFMVYVTESRPDGAGYAMAKRLESYGLVTKLVIDAAVGHLMEQVDLVLVGAEAVVENGGIINKVGTYQISIVAKALNKPFYVTSESFKFSRLYPLNQRDIPNSHSSSAAKVTPIHKLPSSASARDLQIQQLQQQPYLDYTPPAYITLLFTDLGVLTPSAVSDELIKLYN